MGELLIWLGDHGIAVSDQGFDYGGTGLVELVHITSLCLSGQGVLGLSLIHISEPTRLDVI
eukprot:8472961-Prorocentrum_lima.AAC.1